MSDTTVPFPVPGARPARRGRTAPDGAHGTAPDGGRGRAPDGGRGTRLTPSALPPGDLLRVASVGLRSRRLRASLSALGIAIGIAAMVAVLGISESSKSHLLASLDRLGTNLLMVEPGGGFMGRDDAVLPTTSEAMLRRIGPVDDVSSVTSVDATVRRTDLISADRTKGITVKAADVQLLDTLVGEMAQGEWLDATRSRLPVVVLGSVAAQRLGLTDVDDGVQVWLGGRWFSVIGIMEPLELAPDLDSSAIIGRDIATGELGAADTPGTVYLRADPDKIDDVQAVVAPTANPENPDQVEVSRPSDAIEARAAASNAFTALFLGLGAVALLVGGVGIANVMVISVLERRSEIGLRRALGATRRHVSVQFLAEALLLSAAGGVGGVLLGAGVTAAYDMARGWAVVVPAVGLVGGVVAALAIGAVAGLYPATRAARLAPTDALRTV
ncbi:MAG TPA: ABC transporter permease [Acidimicrobiales bacterium]|nr:ABC transporter permease [Acidimicrobiales bacterium]